MAQFLRRHRDLIALNALCLVVLLPFLAKPFHIDDPLYLWTAEHARQHPLDPYGLEVNWYGWRQPMSRVINNPPVVPYYLALWSAISWREELLHAAMLLPALALATGTYQLARRLCAHPFAAAAAAMLAPATLVSSTTVMVDVTMLCFYVWSIYCWIRGIDERRTGLLVLAGALAALSGLSKYFGVSLVPLLAAYALLRTRRVGVWTIVLLIPTIALAGFQLWTKSLYGRGMLLYAAGYAVDVRWGWGLHWLEKAFAGFAFLGGLFATSVALFLVTRGRRLWLTFAVWSGVLLLVILVLQPFTTPSGEPRFKTGAWFVVQLAVFTAGGIVMLWETARTWWSQRRDADATLLLLWIAGTLVFATLVNWTTNARSLLPIAPAAAMLALRPQRQRSATVAGETDADEPRPASNARIAAAVTVGAMLALAAAAGDYALARASRVAAERFALRATDAPGTHWHLGHWGFQWYMTRLGFTSVDAAGSILLPGEHIAVPRNNSNVLPLPQASLKAIDQFAVPVLPFATTMNRSTGAGFYSDVWGPLPFSLGPTPAEEFREDEALRRMALRTR